jgi:hypothetical protein
MLQDLEFGHLDNQYHEKTPHSCDRVLCMCGGDILIRRDDDNYLHIPTWAQVKAVCNDWNRWGGMELQFVFSMQEEDYYLWMGEAGEL